MSARPDGGILIGTAAGGIGIYTGRGFDGVLHPSQGPRPWARAFYPIDTVLTDEDGRLWVGSEGGGAARFSGSTWEVLAPDASLVASINGLAIADERAFIGTDQGLVAADGLFAADCRLETVAPDIKITAAMRDGAGELWAGTGGNGVLRFADRNSTPQRELGSAPVPALALAPNGEVWLANGHQPWLTRFRAAKNLPEAEATAWGRLPLNLSVVVPGDITALAVAPNLDIWLGTTQGLVRFSGGNWTRLTTADGLADNHILRLVVTPDGAVWAATPGGLSRYAPFSP